MLSALWKWVLRYLYFWKTAEQLELAGSVKTSSFGGSETGVSTQSPVKTSSGFTSLSIPIASQQHRTTSFALTSLPALSAAQDRQKSTPAPTSLVATSAATQHQKHTSRVSILDWASQVWAYMDEYIKDLADELCTRRDMKDMLNILYAYIVYSKGDNLWQNLRFAGVLLLFQTLLVALRIDPTLTLLVLAASLLIWEIIKNPDIHMYFQERKSPSITELEPPSGSLSGEAVSLHGANFPENPRVFFNGKLATVSWSSATMICANAPPSDTEGPVDVKIEGQTSNSAPQYIYKQSDDRSIRAENSGERIVIHGTGFRKGMSVRVDGKPATDVEIVSDEELSACPPAATKSGVVKLEVLNPNGSVYATTELEYLASTIYDIVPSAGTTPGGGWIDVCGINFVRGQDVMFGDVPALETVFISPGMVRARVPAALQPGRVPIWLRSKARMSGNAPLEYEYVAP